MPMGRLCFSLVVIWIISGGQCALDSNHIDILTSETNQWLVDNPTINPSSEDEGNVSASIILDSDEEISDDYQDFTVSGTFMVKEALHLWNGRGGKGFTNYADANTFIQILDNAIEKLYNEQKLLLHKEKQMLKKFQDQITKAKMLQSEARTNIAFLGYENIERFNTLYQEMNRFVPELLNHDTKLVDDCIFVAMKAIQIGTGIPIIESEDLGRASVDKFLEDGRILKQKMHELEAKLMLCIAVQNGHHVKNEIERNSNIVRSIVNQSILPKTSQANSEIKPPELDVQHDTSAYTSSDLQPTTDQNYFRKNISKNQIKSVFNPGIANTSQNILEIDTTTFDAKQENVSEKIPSSGEYQSTTGHSLLNPSESDNISTEKSAKNINFNPVKLAKSNKSRPTKTDKDSNPQYLTNFDPEHNQKYSGLIDIAFLGYENIERFNTLYQEMNRFVPELLNHDTKLVDDCIFVAMKAIQIGTGIPIIESEDLGRASVDKFLEDGRILKQKMHELEAKLMLCIAVQNGHHVKNEIERNSNIVRSIVNQSILPKTSQAN
eukprot:171826_1